MILIPRPYWVNYPADQPKIPKYDILNISVGFYGSVPDIVLYYYNIRKRYRVHLLCNYQNPFLRMYMFKIFLVHQLIAQMVTIRTWLDICIIKHQARKVLWEPCTYHPLTCTRSKRNQQRTKLSHIRAPIMLWSRMLRFSHVDHFWNSYIKPQVYQLLLPVVSISSLIGLAHILQCKFLCVSRSQFRRQTLQKAGLDDVNINLIQHSLNISRQCWDDEPRKHNRVRDNLYASLPLARSISWRHFGLWMKLWSATVARTCCDFICSTATLLTRSP